MNKYILCFAFCGLSGSLLANNITNELTPINNTGIALQNIDKSIRLQDNFYGYTNGLWLEKAVIPADKSSWGAFNELRESAVANLHSIISQLNQDKNIKEDTNKQKIIDLYSSYMDEATLNKLGVDTLTKKLELISNLKKQKQIAELMAQLSKIGVSGPFDFAIHQDAKDSTIMVADIVQTGLGLPDRDYYIKTDDKKLMAIRDKYLTYVQTMLELSGNKTASVDAKNILDLETKLAQIQWTNVENRDPVKTYNRVELNKLSKLAPDFAWNDYLTDTQLNGKVDYLVISQPTYIKKLNKIIKSTPISIWQAYFKWRLLNSYASYLSKPFVDTSFAFYGTTLRGVPQNQERWKRGIDVVEGSLGEALGQLYVARYFPPENKAKMEALVANLISAYKQSINSLDWMTPATKKQAQVKLDAMMLKIAYPDKWRDYSALTISKDDLVGNIMRSNLFEYNRSINKLGKPVDRTEWGMTPQTVNAYYNPELNEIVFPAAILQPPFFNANVDDAVNYGGIGAVIGHEISHGFDDQGSQYDAKGNLRDWWTKEDRKKFATKTKKLVAQYSSYSPIKGYYVNGELTLGENIADNSGLAIAYKAYRLSLEGKDAPIINGLTGDQRLYLGWAQVWRGKVREQQQLVYLKTDPHSPSEFRANGALVNQPGFYNAFGIKPDDKMYLPPNKRVIIW